MVSLRVAEVADNLFSPVSRRSLVVVVGCRLSVLIVRPLSVERRASSPVGLTAYSPLGPLSLLNVLRILERQVRHEVGMVDDVSLGSALHLVPFRCMSRDNVAHLIGNAALEGQCYSREGMPEGLAALALSCLTIRSNFVLQKLADVGKDRTRNHGIDVHRQRSPHEFLHGLGALACNVDDAALVLHKRDRAMRYHQRERNVVEIVGLQRTAFEGLGPGHGHLLAQFGVLDPLNFRPEFIDRLAHRGLPQYSRNPLAYRVEGRASRATGHMADDLCPKRVRQFAGQKNAIVEQTSEAELSLGWEDEASAPT